MIRLLKIIAWILTTVLMAGIIFFGNAFFGNPVSWLLANHAAKEYVAEKYAGQDIYIDKVGYDFKSTNYFAHILSHSSNDTEFYIDMDMLGHITYDSYENWVLSGHTVEARLQEEYRQLTDPVIQSPSFPYTLDFGCGNLEIQYSTQMEFGIAMPRELLELDKQYDIHALGAEYGVLGFYMMDDDVSVEKAAEIALEIKKQYDAAGVPFRILDMTLRYPRDEDYQRKEGSIYCILAYDDIYEENLVQRVEASHIARMEYFAGLDAMMDKEASAAAEIPVT